MRGWVQMVENLHKPSPGLPLLFIWERGIGTDTGRRGLLT